MPLSIQALIIPTKRLVDLLCDDLAPRAKYTYSSVGALARVAKSPEVMISLVQTVRFVQVIATEIMRELIYSKGNSHNEKKFPREPDQDPMDFHGHGTHVAGIIAAENEW